MQNALERGETLNQARQSFLNSAYDPREVQNAYLMMARINPAAAANPNTPMNLAVATSASQKPKAKSHKVMYIITIIICVLILGGVLAAGLFWDTLFG